MADGPTDDDGPADAERDAAELVARIAAGDEAALGILYDRYAPLAHSVVRRMLGEKTAAEDVVEETFWQAWRSAAEYHAGRGSVAGWLAMMARSRALDWLRARHRRSGGHAALAKPASSPPTANQPELPEPHRRLAEVLAFLPADQREAIELAFFEGLSHTEIAERTRTPLGTVKSRLRRALLALRAQVNMRREPRT